MSFAPDNALDRALIAGHRSPSAMPEVYRQLAEGELFLLIPCHPEFEDGSFQLKNGMEVPFVRQPDGESEAFLIFSSEERAQEGMRRGKVPPNKYLIVSMPALQVMDVLSHLGLRAMINRSCDMPQFTIPPDMMRDIANGEIFRLPDLESVSTEEKRLGLIDPADYPTQLVQPVFEVLRQQRNFRAAWIFTDLEAASRAPSGRAYQLMILMEPQDAAIYHELSLVIAAAHPREDLVSHGLLDENDPAYTAELFSSAEPFHLAADFARPRQREDE